MPTDNDSAEAAHAQGAREAKRLARLRDLMVLGTKPEPLFDGIARLASEVCGTPIALVSLVGAEVQWFKANVGLPGVTGTPRDIAICSHTLASDGVLEIPDTRGDARCADNPLVHGPSDLRYYAGAPLELDDGIRVGALCVIDHQPRKLDELQLRTLRALAGLVSDALDMRRDLIERSLFARSEYERTLAASEAQHRAIVEDQTEMVALSDADCMLRYVNPAYAQPLGFEPHQLVGSSLLDRVDPADRDDVRARLAEVLRTGQPVRSLNRNVSADGTVRWLEWTNRVTTGARGERLVHAVGRDVTEQRRTEEALRASRALLDRTSRIAGVGGWEFDVASSAISWSDQTCRLHEMPLGHSPTLAEGIAYFTPAARPVIEQAVQRGIDSGEPWDLELPIVTARGRPLWVRTVGEAEFDDASSLLRLSGAVQDITERRRLEQRLAERERFVRDITDSVPVRIAYIDLEERYCFVNQAHCRRFGREREQILGRTRSELTRGTIDPVSTDRLAAAMRGERQHFEYTETIDGEARRIESQFIPDVDEDGDVHGVFCTGIDITDRTRIERELAGQHEMTRVTLHSIADAVITTDAAGCVRYMNPVAEQLAGWRADEAAGRPIEQVVQILDEATRRPATNPVERSLSENRAVGLAGDLLLVSRDGSERGIEDTAAPIRGSDGSLLGAVLVFRDVTERRRQANALTYRATHDKLTGLANRGEFESRLAGLLDGARSDGMQHALMAIDLDRFKLVNDACGHAAGDRLLCQVSALLRQCVRSRDIVARLGGDEFGVILEQCTVEQAGRVAQQICDRVGAFRFVHDGRAFGVGASIGLVPLDARWADIADALQAADAACYAAKHAGRSRVHTGWGDAGHEPAGAPGLEGNWAERLQKALDGDGFELQALPIEALDAAAYAAPGRYVELRACLIDGSRRIAAAEFMPAAERFQLAPRIDRWLVEAACARLAGSAGAATGLALVALSAPTLADRTLHRRLADAVAALGPRAAALCIELHEAAVLAHPAEAAELMQMLRGAGARIALGGLGAGTSTLALLRTLPVDIVKLDPAVVRGVADDAFDRAAVRCWRDAARALPAVTIAAGVEREDVRAKLQRLGIDLAQGALFDSPARQQPAAVQPARVPLPA